jgi:hypothetical protein
MRWDASAYKQLLLLGQDLTQYIADLVLACGILEEELGEEGFAEELDEEAYMRVGIRRAFCLLWP